MKSFAFIKPGLHDRGGGKVLISGKRCRKESSEIELNALRFEFRTVILPGEVPAPIFPGIE